MKKPSYIILLINMILVFSLLSLGLKAFAQSTKGDVSALSWNQDGVRLAIGFESGLIEVVNTQTGETVFTNSALQRVASLDWSPLYLDYLAVGGKTGSLAGTVIVINTLSNQIQYSLESGESLSSTAWSPDGTKIAATSNIVGTPITSRNEVRVWDAGTGELLTNSLFSIGPITSIAWSPTSQQIAGSTTDHVTLIWDVATGAVIHTLTGHTDVVMSVAWSSDGRQLATTGSVLDNTVRIWNADTSENISSFPSRFGIVRWSAVGNLLAIGESGSLRLLDAGTGEELGSIQLNAVSRAFAYSPYGGRLALAGSAPSTHTMENAVQTLANGAVQIVVPVPSPERLQAIADACNAPAAVEQSLTASLQADQLSTFITQVEALPENTIPPACADDLIAVAEALQSR